MNRNVMIVLAGGFLIAVLVALLVQASLSGGKKKASVTKEEPRVHILVASKDLKAGTELSDKNMKWRQWPENAVFPGAIQREGDKEPNEAIAGRLKQPVREGQPITKSALVADEGNYLAAALREGMRAFSVPVGTSGMVSGFIGPGDYVDVLLTYERRVNYAGANDPEVRNMMERTLDERATETIMQNVRVLAVNQSAVADEERDAVKKGKMVTLEVDYKGAEILALASKMGSISLALRRLGDETIVLNRPPVTTDARTTTIDDEILAEIGKTQDNTSQNARIVRIYRGQSIEDLTVPSR